MALTVTIEINDHDEKVLLNDLIDIDAWVQGEVAGKLNNCGKRMAQEAAQVLKNDPSVSTMPATDQGLQEALLARPDYQNRSDRDAAES